MRTDDAGHGGGGLDKLWGSSAVDYLGRGIDAEAHLERERGAVQRFPLLICVLDPKRLCVCWGKGFFLVRRRILKYRGEEVKGRVYVEVGSG